jgi:hypothetical protein
MFFGGMLKKLADYYQHGFKQSYQQVFKGIKQENVKNQDWKRKRYLLQWIVSFRTLVRTQY